MVNLDKLKEQEEGRQENIRRLEKFKRVKLVTKDEVVAKFGGDIVPTRYGFMSTNISEEDYEKVLEIESRMHDYMTSEIAMHTLMNLGDHQGVSEDIKERAIKLRSDLYHELEVNIYEKGNVEYALIDKLIQPLIDKGVYVPKNSTVGICFMTMTQLSIDGFFNPGHVMLGDVDESIQRNKFRLVVM